jgi:hypothetical protein
LAYNIIALISLQILEMGAPFRAVKKKQHKNNNKNTLLKIEDFIDSSTFER